MVKNMGKAKIYVRDREEKEYLKGKYPEVNALYAEMPEKFKKGAKGPIVCVDSDTPLNECPQGEEEIEKLKE